MEIAFCMCLITIIYELICYSSVKMLAILDRQIIYIHSKSQSQMLFIN